MTEDMPQTTANWLDVSVPLYTGMAHWPDNPPVEIERAMSIDRGDTANVSKISLGAHTGTHMDAPLHFFKDGISIDQMPLIATMGRARVIEISDPESIKPAELERHAIQLGERLLFKTRNSERAWHTDDFVKDFVYISKEAAAYLAKMQVQTVGVDYLSVGGFFKDGPETHYALLGAGIWIIEGLNLSQVQAGDYDLICLPLKLRGSEGAPARAVVRAIAKSPQETTS
ncbi:MAG: cyclase family protein [Ktedonobacteraceae bacterium]